jgi:hypothetical protein
LIYASSGEIDAYERGLSYRCPLSRSTGGAAAHILGRHPGRWRTGHTALIVKDYGDWMATNNIPKLLISGDPGAVLTGGSLLEFCRTWRNQEEATVGGRHFLQEDSHSLHEIGQAIAQWLIRLPGSHQAAEA